jgi:predicted glutamine amidotransferase
VCELFALCARLPTTVRLSLDELARHGGEVGPHKDGWGVGFVQETDALLVREPEAASESQCLTFLRRQHIRSSTVIAHIRKATQGPRLLRNTQPFTRELGGRVHLFAHNGMLPGIEAHGGFPTRRFRCVGDTDSEHAFCALLEALAPLWEDATPSVDDRLAVISVFAEKLRPLGPANFLYSDGDAVFVHGHRRRDATGEIRPPGLHVLCRTCSATADGCPLPGVALEHDHEQEVALVASVPLTDEPWEALAEGEIIVLREGRIAVRRRA